MASKIKEETSFANGLKKATGRLTKARVSNVKSECSFLLSEKKGRA